MKIFKSMLLLISAILISMSATATTFNAASKSITVVIPFAPGGGVDLTFRHLQKYASAKGIEMVAVYKPGADGLIGMNELASLPKDGYHVSVGTMATVATHRLKNANSTIVPVTGIKESITAFVTPSTSSIKNIDELDVLMKAGNSVNFGYGAPGQKMVLDELFLQSNAKLPQTMVPYKGGGPLVTDIVGGHVNLAALPLAIVKSHIDSGKLRIIAIAGRGKLNIYPEVPSITKKYPKYGDTDGFAFIVPGNTNVDAVNFWNNFLKEYVNSAQIQKEFQEEFTNPLPFGSATAESMIANSMKRLKE
jgi:tripartite-type tricarboxylate transporter receptor subunit TctC